MQTRAAGLDILSHAIIYISHAEDVKPWEPEDPLGPLGPQFYVTLYQINKYGTVRS